MIEYGKICEIDAAKGLVRAVIPARDNLLTEWCPFMRPFAGANSISIPIEVDMLVLVGKTCSGGNWFVLGAAANNVDVPYTGASENKLGVKFSDGCLVEYDTDSHELTVNTPGAVKITSAVKVSLEVPELDVTAPVISFTGSVTVSGALSAAGGLSVTGGDITTPGNVNAGDVKAGTVSLKSHKHTGVQTGAGVSGGPV